MAQKPARNWAHPRALMRGEIPLGDAQRELPNGDLEVLFISDAELDEDPFTGEWEWRFDASKQVFYRSHVADDVFTEGDISFEFLSPVKRSSGFITEQAVSQWKAFKQYKKKTSYIKCGVFFF